MTSTLAEALGERRRIAAELAVEAAERLADGGHRDVTAQLAVEQALDDLVRYDDLYGKLSGLAGDLGVCRRGGPHGLIGDLHRAHTGDRRAADRLVAHGRAYRAGDIEQRDIGASSVWASIPQWLLDLPVPTTATISPALSIFARPLPAGARGTVNALKWSTAPTAAAQSALNASISTPSVADSAVGPAVKTYATRVTASLQLVEQGSVAVDAALVPELVHAIDGALSVDLWTADGTSGTVPGLLHQSGVGTVTYTDTTPTLIEFMPYLEATIRSAEVGRGGQPIVFMHPRRLSWLRQRAVVEQVTALDFDAATIPGATCTMLGTVNVCADASIPTTLGAGTNQDLIAAFRSTDVVDLWTEAPAITVGASTSVDLAAYIEVHRYAALATRLPAAVALLSGTGLAAPSP